MPDNKSKLVYSTDRAIARKEKSHGQAVRTDAPPSQQRVTVRLDRKGRGGKSVTVIDGLSMPSKEKEALLKQLKTRFGAGGTVTMSGIEIQGDHCDAVIEALKKSGYPAKRSGG
jgi:translation initiation factor 1